MRLTRIVLLAALVAAFFVPALAASPTTSPQWVDVTASPYNADPTGGSDSAAAFRAAISAALSAGKPLYIPQGTYEWNSAVTIDTQGYGAGGFRVISDNAVINATGVGGQALAIQRSGGTTGSPAIDTAFRLSGGLTVNGNAASAYVVRIGKTDFSDLFAGAKIDGLVVSNASSASGAGGLQVNNCDHCDTAATITSQGGSASTGGIAIEQAVDSQFSGASSVAGASAPSILIENGASHGNVFGPFDLGSSATCVSVTTSTAASNLLLAPYFACSQPVNAPNASGALDVIAAGFGSGASPTAAGLKVIGAGALDRYSAPAVASKTLSGGDCGTIFSSGSATSGTLAITLPAGTAVRAGCSYGFVTGAAKGATVTAPGGASILGGMGGLSLSALTLPSVNEQFVALVADGTNYRIKYISRALALYDGVENDGAPTLWTSPSSSGYALTQADNGHTLSSGATSAGLALTLPATSAIVAGWTIGLAPQGAGKPISVTGGSILFPSGKTASSANFPTWGEINLQYDGSVFRLMSTTGGGAFGWPVSATELSDLSTADYNVVHRQGFASPGDAPELDYRAETGTCASNGLISNGGGCENSWDSNSWRAIWPASGIDLSEYGVVYNWNGSTGTDSGVAANAAIVDACALAAANGTSVLTDGGQDWATSIPLVWAHCSGVKYRFDVHALAGSQWTSGLTATQSVTYISPNTQPPYTTVANIWAPTSPWPSAQISGVLNDGGQIELVLASPLTLTTGQLVKVDSAIIPPATYWQNLTNPNLDWYATVIDSEHVVLQGSSYASVGAAWASSTALGTLWGPLPVGLVFIDATANTLTSEDSTIDCNAECQVADTVYGNGLVMRDEAETGYSAAAVFTFGRGAKLYRHGGSWTQPGGFSNLADRTAWGMYWAGLASDSIVDDGALGSFNFRNFFVDYSSQDEKFIGAHLFSGLPNDLVGIGGGATNSGVYYPAITGVFRGAGMYVDNVTDNSAVEIDTKANGFAPNVQVSGNFAEPFAAGMEPGLIDVVAECGTPQCANLGLDSKLGVDADQMAAHNLGQQTGGWLAGHIALLDGNNLIDSYVWSNTARAQAARINNWTSSRLQPMSPVLHQSSYTITATVTANSNVLSAVSMFPALGSAVSDSCGAVPANSTLGSFWPAYEGGGGIAHLTNQGGLPSVSCGTTSAPDTIFIGTGPGALALTGIVTADNPDITSVAFPFLQNGEAIACAGVAGPAAGGSWWIAGYDPFDGRLGIDGQGHTAPTTGGTSLTCTVTPSQYTLQPDDAASVFANSGSIAAVMYLPSDDPIGESFEIDNENASVELLPLGGSQINAMGSGTSYTIYPSGLSRGVVSGSLGTGADRYSFVTNPASFGNVADNAPCQIGQVNISTTFAYFCTAPNTWQRVAISPF